MIDSKVYHILNSLKKDRLKKLYLSINERKPSNIDDKLRIILYIIESIFNKIVLPSKTKFFKSNFNNVTNSNKINLLMSEAVKFIEEFIIIEEMLQDKEMKNFYLSKFYYKNKLNTYYEQSYKSGQKLFLENISLRNYALQVETEFLNARYLALNNNRTVDFNLVENSLEVFYYTWKLKLNNLLLVNNKEREEKNNPNSVLYLLYSNIDKLFNTQDDLLFKNIFESISFQINHINQSELRVITMLLDNYCILQINLGKQDYLKSLFMLYQKIIDWQVLLDDDDTLLAGQYKNIITIALRNQEYDWAEWFLEKYKHTIRDDKSEEAYIFNKASILFEKKQYETCLDIASRIVIKDFFYKLSVKRMQIKALLMLYIVDKSYFDTLYSHINAFKKFIYTKKNLSKIYIESNKNFYKFINQIFYSYSLDKKKLKDLKINIQECDVLAEKAWLLSIIK